jgi:hypothetical protein
MKNITISVDDDLYRQARIKAAEQSTSISALFKNFLILLTVRESAETEFQRLACSDFLNLRIELRQLAGVRAQLGNVPQPQSSCGRREKIVA